MLVEIHGIASQTAQTRLERGRHLFSAAQRTWWELRRNDHSRAVGQLTQAAFGTSTAVHRCRVEEVHLRRDTRVERRLLIVGVGPAVRRLCRHQTVETGSNAPDHHAQAEGWDLNAAPAQRDMHHADAPHCFGCLQ